jgi:hypothetical protein
MVFSSVTEDVREQGNKKEAMNYLKAPNVNRVVKHCYENLSIMG